MADCAVNAPACVTIKFDPPARIKSPPVPSPFIVILLATTSPVGFTENLARPSEFSDVSAPAQKKHMFG